MGKQKALRARQCGALLAWGAMLLIGAAHAQGSPGMTWNSLSALPELLNATWVPENQPQDERQLLSDMALPPLQASARAAAEQAIARLHRGEDPLPSAGCGALGQPRLGWYPYPLQFLYGAGNVMIEEAHQVRQIPVSGIHHSSTLMDPNALQALQINGDVSGYWDGDALVIDTLGVREDIETFYGVDHDPALHVVERYRLADHDTLERITTVEAPSVFTKPWVIRTVYRRAPLKSYVSSACESKKGWLTPGPLPKLAVPPQFALGDAASVGAAKRFTANMSWASIQQLPRLWGVRWSSPESYDATQIVLSALTYPPLKPQYLAKSKQRVLNIMQGKSEFKQAACAPNGMTRSIWYTSAPVFLFEPGSRLVLAESEFREIFMDGRTHPEHLDENDPTIRYEGHSIGWWEGSALVIDTVGINPRWDLFYGVPYGGPNHVVERYELLTPDSLRVTVTVEAPAVLEKPWVFTKTYTLQPGNFGQGGPKLSAAEARTEAESQGGGAGTFSCVPSDSRQKVDVNGALKLDLTPPPPGLH